MASEASSGRTRWTGEALMLVGALVMTMAVAWPLGCYIGNRRAVWKTRRAIREFLDAAARYHLEYGHWPGAGGALGTDIRFGAAGRPNRRLVGLLQGSPRRPAPGAEQPGPQGIVFWQPAPWEPGEVGVNEFGEWLDPWGMPFQVVVDGDWNGVCDVPHSAYGQVEAGLLAWSYGPDRRSDTADDIRSW